jgi:hypothetical protein
MPDKNSPEERRTRLRRWLVGVPLLLLLIGVSLTAVCLESTGSQELADAMSAADRDDPYWRLDDLMAHRETVPDAENSALVLAKASALLRENWPPRAPAASGTSTTVSIATASAFEQLDTIDENIRLDDTIAGALRSELKVREAALAIARTVRDFGRGRHELVVGPTVIDTPLPETQAARSVARLLEADAAMRANDDDLDGALDSCRAIIGTARSIGDEPTLVSQLVRISIDRAAMKSARRVLGQGEPSDAALSRLQALILDEHAQPLLLIGMKGERATLTEMMRRIEAGELPLSAISGKATPPSFGARARTKMFATLAQRVLGGQRALSIKWLNEAVAISRQPVLERRALWAVWDAKIAAVKQSRFGPFTAMLPLSLVPATTAANTAFNRAQAELGTTAILIAAERHRLKTGKWPASIEAIDKSILPNAPVDPFSGQPFRFEQRDGQLFIYSIGPNGIDDHGAYDPKQSTKGAPDDVGARAWDINLRRRPAVPADK